VASTLFDWQSFESNGVVRTAANVNCTATTPGNPVNVANTSSAGPNSDGSTGALPTGWHYLQPAQRLSFTPEFSVNPASFSSLKFSWFQLNADATRGIRLAIRIGSTWYVSATVQTGPAGTTADWATLSQLKEVTFNPAAANWRLLNFNGNYTLGGTPGTGTGTSSTLGNITVGAQPGANLSGTITAFGLFSDGVGTGNSRFDSFTVTGDNSGLPSPWQSQDIGAVAVPGSASASGGVFTITGNGADIWTTADEFQFVYQPASGDCDIRARVVTQQNTHAFAKAGVMVRESLNANASEVMTAITPGNGVTFVRRNGTGAASTSLNTAGITAPQWVRVQRTGNTFTAFFSPDGSAWTTIGSTNITMSTSVFIGLPVCSHADGTNCTATFDNVTALP
jgi:regulation of enolase protein 1 (concanavalin A-like superfamily)